MADTSHPQIHIPIELPEILKQFTKAAVEAQPKDVLAWEAAYFRALADGEREPGGPGTGKKTQLTVGLIRILNKQLGPKVHVKLGVIKEKWTNLSLLLDQFNCLAKIGKFQEDVQWIKFLSLACSSIGTDIMDAMKIVCQVLSPDPNGKVPFELFMDIYRYLASIDGTIPCEKIERVRLHMLEHDVQYGCITPKSFMKSDVLTGF